MNRKVVAAVVIGALLFTGWWIFGRQSPPDSSSTPSASAPVLAEAQPTQVSSTTAPPDASPTAADDRASSTGSSAAPLPSGQQRQVKEFAVRFMKTFARPGQSTSSSTWWKRVAAMLTDDAVDDYLGIDPALVPFTRVTGAPRVVPSDRDSDADWLQEVTVPTDAGTYRVWVQLVTPGLSDRLLVAEIDEP